MNTKNQLTSFNQSIIKEFDIQKDLKKLRACIQCGECTASCLSGNWTSLRTRKVMRKAIVGYRKVLSDDSLWYCTTCYQCYERCPRTIPVTDIIIKLRNIAVREGYIPEQLKGVIKNLVQTGHAVPLGGKNSKWAQLRKYFNLDQIPPIVHKFPEALDEIFTIINKIKFNARIPYRL